MIFKLEQTGKDLYAAQFLLKRSDKKIGEASVNGKFGHMEAVINGFFYNTEFEMRYGKNKYVASKPFRPYKISINGAETGIVYQAEQKTGLFRSRSFHQMVRDGQTYECYAIALAGEKTKHPIYCGNRQLALVETDSIIYNDLFHFYAFAEDESAGMTALLFCLYMYVNACYKPGVKVTQAVSENSFVTKDPFLLGKYDPDYKEKIEE